MATHPHRVQDTGAPFDPQEREEWRKLFDAFLVAATEADAQAALKGKKKARLAIHAYLCALDNQLRVTCGFGLARFLAPATR
eukprot:926888-Lingulodinium_polyedra.AAC.1